MSGDSDTTKKNVKSDAPIDKYKTSNQNPSFDTDSKDVTFGSSGGAPVNSGS